MEQRATKLVIVIGMVFIVPTTALISWVIMLSTNWYLYDSCCGTRMLDGDIVACVSISEAAHPGEGKGDSVIAYSQFNDCAHRVSAAENREPEIELSEHPC